MNNVLFSLTEFTERLVSEREQKCYWAYEIIYKLL